jgi:hypothetical protein
MISVAEIEAIIEPDSVGNDIWWGRLAGIGAAYRYSSTDSTRYGLLTWQYPMHSLAH